MSLNSKKVLKERLNREASLSSIKEAIQKYFDSFDPEMWKLGQRLCHTYRICYYVLVDFQTKVRNPSVIFRTAEYYTEKKVVQFSLKGYDGRFFWSTKSYYINFYKNNKILRYAEKAKKIKDSNI